MDYGYHNKYHNKHRKLLKRIDFNYREINSIQKIVDSYFEKMCDELKNQSVEFYLELMKSFDSYILISEENKFGQSEFLTDTLYGLQNCILTHFGIYGLFEKIEKIIWSEKIVQEIIFNRKYVYHQIFKVVQQFEYERTKNITEDSFKQKVEESLEVLENVE